MVTVCSNMSMTVCSNMSQITGDVHLGEFVEEKHLPFGWHIALRIYKRPNRMLRQHSQSFVLIESEI